MFSGIIQAQASVKQLEPTNSGARLSLKLPSKILVDLQVGASLAVNGVCLSFLHIKGGIAFFDLVPETLEKTNLSELKTKQLVNIERALKLSDEIGGNFLSGHIFQTVPFLAKKNHLHYFGLSSSICPYLFSKGFIALNGASLTVVNVQKKHFCVALIPHTLKNTNLVDLKKGDRVNLEIDTQIHAIVNTLKNFLLKNKN